MYKGKLLTGAVLSVFMGRRIWERLRSGRDK